jgi:hypothetical protein
VAAQGGAAWGPHDGSIHRQLDEAVDGCRRELSAVTTRRDLDVGVDENAVVLRGGRWSGRRGGACEGNKRQGVWGPAGCLVAARATRRQGAGEGPDRRLRAAEDRHRPESSGSGPVHGAGGAAAKTGEGEPLMGGPPLQCREARQIRFEFEKLIQMKFKSFQTLTDSKRNFPGSIVFK